MLARRAAPERNGLIDIFMEKRPRLIQLAARIIGCQCLAEDVVQETMLKICEGGIEEEVKAPAAYLFRMVRNLAIDGARRRAREMGLGRAEEEGGELVAHCPCPEETMARCQALRIVAAALQELPERTRHAFEMHRIEGVSQRDIACELRVSPTLVNFMVRDAHNHCRAKLLNGEVDGDMVPAPAGRQSSENAAPRERPRRKGGGTSTPRKSDDEVRRPGGGGRKAGENAIKSQERGGAHEIRRQPVQIETHGANGI
jgi:RNA polymerase sigma factor (sigma-70 family)